MQLNGTNRYLNALARACLLLLVCTSCNVVKYLKPGQELYTGAEISVSGDQAVNTKQVKKTLERVLRPEPNQTIAGIRFKLWFYYAAGEDPKKGFKKWMKYKLGEKPVLYDPQIPAQVSEIMANRLHNTGYFNAAVTYSTEGGEGKRKIFYNAKLSTPYRLGRVSVPQGTTVLGMHIKDAESESVLKTGRQYDLDMIRMERERIDQHLKNEGFYYFHPDYILFKADSSRGEKTVDLVLTLKPEIPDKALVQYFIHNVYVHAAHRLRDSARRQKSDTLLVDGIHYITPDSTFRPRAITRSVFIRKGERYSRQKHSLTLSRLMGMGVFQYANIRFHDTVVAGRGMLNAYIYLTPMKKRSIQAELQAVTKSNNYTGPALTLSYRNRNLLRGAELFVFNLNANYETQFTGIQKGFNSYEVGANTQLYLQKFLVPFRLKNVSSFFVPRTKFDIGFRNLNRVLYYSMNSVNFSFGYTWNETREKSHELNPVAINFARVMHSTAAFDELLSANPFLRRSFEQQFTLGGFYAFTYNSLNNANRHNQYYYNGLLDISGNLASLYRTLRDGHRPDPVHPFALFGYNYSQYAKTAHDLRFHHTINRNSKVASRIIAGVGFPYGNSNSMPYIKQFFSGGSNSIRAFLPRTVGPGVYVTPDSLLRRRFLDQAGDIKLEGNVEYRFTIISVLKGAVFVDGGNVWLLRKTDQVPGGEFMFSEFYKQLAVGTGFGLRLDVTYFVLRFDVGMALRRPYLPFGQRWVIRHIDLGDNSWRRQNLVLNIAIGYPF